MAERSGQNRQNGKESSVSLGPEPSLELKQAALEKEFQALSSEIAQKRILSTAIDYRQLSRKAFSDSVETAAATLAAVSTNSLTDIFFQSGGEAATLETKNLKAFFQEKLTQHAADISEQVLRGGTPRARDYMPRSMPYDPAKEQVFDTLEHLIEQSGLPSNWRNYSAENAKDVTELESTGKLQKPGLAVIAEEVKQGLELEQSLYRLNAKARALGLPGFRNAEVEAFRNLLEQTAEDFQTEMPTKAKAYLEKATQTSINSADSETKSPAPRFYANGARENYFKQALSGAELDQAISVLDRLKLGADPKDIPMDKALLALLGNPEGLAPKILDPAAEYSESLKAAFFKQEETLDSHLQKLILLPLKEREAYFQSKVLMDLARWHGGAQGELEARGDWAGNTIYKASDILGVVVDPLGLAQNADSGNTSFQMQRKIKSAVAYFDKNYEKNRNRLDTLLQENKHLELLSVLGHQKQNMHRIGDLIERAKVQDKHAINSLMHRVAAAELLFVDFLGSAAALESAAAARGGSSLGRSSLARGEATALNKRSISPQPPKAPGPVSSVESGGGFIPKGNDLSEVFSQVKPPGSSPAMRYSLANPELAGGMRASGNVIDQLFPSSGGGAPVARFPAIKNRALSLQTVGAGKEAGKGLGVSEFEDVFIKFPEFNPSEYKTLTPNTLTPGLKPEVLPQTKELLSQPRFNLTLPQRPSTQMPELPSQPLAPGGIPNNPVSLPPLPGTRFTFPLEPASAPQAFSAFAVLPKQASIEEITKSIETDLDSGIDDFEKLELAKEIQELLRRGLSPKEFKQELTDLGLNEKSIENISKSGPAPELPEPSAVPRMAVEGGPETTQASPTATPSESGATDNSAMPLTPEGRPELWTLPQAIANVTNSMSSFLERNFGNSTGVPESFPVLRVTEAGLSRVDTGAPVVEDLLLATTLREAGVTYLSGLSLTRRATLLALHEPEANVLMTQRLAELGVEPLRIPESRGDSATQTAARNLIASLPNKTDPAEAALLTPVLEQLFASVPEAGRENLAWNLKQVLTMGSVSSPQVRFQTLRYLSELSSFLDRAKMIPGAEPRQITQMLEGMRSQKLFALRPTVETARVIFEQVLSDCKRCGRPEALPLLLSAAFEAPPANQSKLSWDRFDFAFPAVREPAVAGQAEEMQRGLSESALYRDLAAFLRQKELFFGGTNYTVERIRPLGDSSSSSGGEFSGKSLAFVGELRSASGNTQNVIVKNTTARAFRNDQIATEAAAALGITSYRVERFGGATSPGSELWEVIEQRPSEFIAYEDGLGYFNTAAGIELLATGDVAAQNQRLRDLGTILALEHALDARDCKAKHILFDTETARPFRIDWEMLLEFDTEAIKEQPAAFQGDEQKLIRALIQKLARADAGNEIETGFRDALAKLRTDFGNAPGGVSAALARHLSPEELTLARARIAARLAEHPELIVAQLKDLGLNAKSTEDISKTRPAQELPEGKAEPQKAIDEQ